MCVLGKRLLSDVPKGKCTQEVGGHLHDLFCEKINGTSKYSCDSYFTGKFGSKLLISLLLIFNLCFIFISSRKQRISRSWNKGSRKWCIFRQSVPLFPR